jgi:hypothetical protein
MLDTIFSSLRAQVATLQLEIERRKKISTADPVADGMAFAVSEFAESVRLLESESEWLTPDQYGELHQVCGQTVRNWIARGELKAEPTAKGYKIPRSALRQRRLKRAG